MENQPSEYEYYLVGFKNEHHQNSHGQPMRIARFNGFGQDKGWGGMDWSGDSGHSTDSWMHDDVEWFLPLNKFSITVDQSINGATKIVTSVNYQHKSSVVIPPQE